jgi:hypothetical protein
VANANVGLQTQVSDMLKKFLNFLGEKTQSKTSEPNSIANEENMGMEGVWKDNKFYFNRRKEGYVNGKHFTEYVETVKQLKRAGKLDEAEALLLKLVDATEAESTKGVGGVAPWYYEQLAIIYRKQNKVESEISILNRYENQEKAPGVKPGILSARLLKAEELGRKAKS